MTNSTERTVHDYVDLDEQLPEYECSRCGYLHDEEEAFGLGRDGDQCPACDRSLLAHSKQVPEIDTTPGELSVAGSRTVRL